MIAFANRPARSDLVDESISESRPPRPATGLLILAICAAACLVNPFTYNAYTDAISPYLQLFEPATKITILGTISFFGPWIRQNTGPEWYLIPTFYVMVVLVGLASFFLNSRRFSWARFLPFAAQYVGDVGHLHELQLDVRGRLRRGRRAQRPGAVPRSNRDRRPAGTAVDILVNRRPVGHACLDLSHDRHRHHRVEQHATRGPVWAGIQPGRLSVRGGGVSGE